MRSLGRLLGMPAEKIRVQYYEGSGTYGHSCYDDIAQASAFDLSWLISPGSIRASLITGMLGLQPVPTVAEISLWLVYAITMSVYVLWPHGRTPAKRVPAQPEPAPAGVV